MLVAILSHQVEPQWDGESNLLLICRSVTEQDVGEDSLMI